MSSKHSLSLAASLTALLLTALSWPLALSSRTRAQTVTSQPPITFTTITRWHDSLQTLQAPTLIPKRYSAWQRHYEKTLAEYQRDSTGASYRNKAQQCALEFTAIEPFAYTTYFLSAVDSALERARNAGAKRFASTTLARARMYREKSANALRADRTNARGAALERSRAKYEARHALTIAQLLKPFAEQRQSCEQIILASEKQLQRLGAALDIQLRFAHGSDSAVVALLSAIAEVNLKREDADSEMESVDSTLKRIFVDIGTLPPKEASAEAYAKRLGDEFRKLVRELDDSKRELRQYRRRVRELQQEKETTETILSTKEAEEQRFKQTRALFQPDEALILYNGSRDVVIRLRGLTFPSGVAQLSPRHDSLLAKVTKALTLYPTARIVVEGHTDNTGGSKLNVRLSQKRAQAVMKRLIESTGRPAEKFKAVGYGAEKPVANNQTERGRRENRRIDIVMVR